MKYFIHNEGVLSICTYNWEHRTLWILLIKMMFIKVYSITNTRHSFKLFIFTYMVDKKSDLVISE